MSLFEVDLERPTEDLKSQGQDSDTGETSLLKKQKTV